MKPIILSILIPTYNRVGFLETTVEYFIQQIVKDGLENRVEILIGNDDPKDSDTVVYTNQLSYKHNFVHCWNHPKNLGLSQNVEFLVKEAGGEYILISGEDDLTKEGALKYYIDCIREKSPNYILVNTSNIISSDNANRDFKIVLENRLNIHENIFMEDWDKDGYLLKPARNWLYLTNFLTAVVFKKNLFQSELNNAKKYIRPENVWLWQAPNIIGIKKYGRLLVIAKCFVLCRNNENHWGVNDVRGSYFINLFDSIGITKIIKDYMPSEYKKYKKLYASFVMKTFTLETEKGKDIRKFALIAFRNNFDCFPENIQFLAMSIAPKLIIQNNSKLRTYKKFIFDNEQ